MFERLWYRIKNHGKIASMKDFQEKKKKTKKQVGYRTSKRFLRNFNRQKTTTNMGARPRAAFGGHQ